MPRKRKAIKKPPQGERSTPLRVVAPGERKRHWYHAPLTLAANGVAAVLGIFRRRRKPIVQKKPPRAAQRRRKN
jgi:hypothetical protein